eukprot:scaffold191_cov273-Chaetoceros_neogracile.AAC.12
MVTIAAGRANLNKGYLTSQAFMDTVKKDMSIADAPDLYYFDCATNKFQHLFQVLDSRLFLRPSSVINDPVHNESKYNSLMPVHDLQKYLDDVPPDVEPTCILPCWRCTDSI